MFLASVPCSVVSENNILSHERLQMTAEGGLNQKLDIRHCEEQQEKT